MKSVLYLAPAVRALRRHRRSAARIMAKIDAYAAEPTAFANVVTPLRGRAGKRMWIGDFRVLFEETATQIIVSDIGPRSDLRMKEAAVSAKIFVTPAGEELAVLPRADYEDLRDALAHQRAMAAYRAGAVGALSSEDTKALLEAPTPLAFWRAKRGLTQAALAKAARTTQPHIADLEAGKRKSSLAVMARIAKALDVKVDDLIEEAGEGE